MNPAIEETIIHFYPDRILESPLNNKAVRWIWDPDFEQLSTVIDALGTLDPHMRPGHRCEYEISEELILFDDVRVQLCYLGPFAALSHGAQPCLNEQVQSLLEAHGLTVLDADTLEETSRWIKRTTVWECLFGSISFRAQ